MYFSARTNPKAPGWRFTGVSATSVKLLRAASEIVGGDSTLADRLGISEMTLSVYMTDSRELPDQLLLRALDIILAERQLLPPLPSEESIRPAPESPRDG